MKFKEKLRRIKDFYVNTDKYHRADRIADIREKREKKMRKQAEEFEKIKKQREKDKAALKRDVKETEVFTKAFEVYKKNPTKHNLKRYKKLYKLASE